MTKFVLIFSDLRWPAVTFLREENRV